MLNARSLCGFRKGSDEFLRAKRQWRDAEYRGTVAGLGNPSAAISWSEGRHAFELFLHKFPLFLSRHLPLAPAVQGTARLLILDGNLNLTKAFGGWTFLGKM